MGAAFMDNPVFYTYIGALRGFHPEMTPIGSTANYQLAELNREIILEGAANHGYGPCERDPRTSLYWLSHAGFQ